MGAAFTQYDNAALCQQNNSDQGCVSLMATNTFGRSYGILMPPCCRSPLLHELVLDYFYMLPFLAHCQDRWDWQKFVVSCVDVVWACHVCSVVACVCICVYMYECVYVCMHVQMLATVLTYHLQAFICLTVFVYARWPRWQVSTCQICTCL